MSLGVAERKAAGRVCTARGWRRDLRRRNSGAAAASMHRPVGAGRARWLVALVEEATCERAPVRLILGARGGYGTSSGVCVIQQPARQREQHVRAHKRLSTGEQEQQQSLLPYSSSSSFPHNTRVVPTCMPITATSGRANVAPLRLASGESGAFRGHQTHHFWRLSARRCPRHFLRPHRRWHRRRTRTLLTSARNRPAPSASKDGSAGESNTEGAGMHLPRVRFSCPTTTTTT